MKCLFAYKTPYVVFNILHTLNLDTTISEIATIVKVKIASFRFDAEDPGQSLYTPITVGVIHKTYK